MVLGMSTVFAFLVLLIGAMSAMSALLGRLLPVPEAETEDDADTALMTAVSAAVVMHHSRR